ncbi:MAG: GGDEF domain-containing protein [Steroidobacteraceae bacterium]
MLIWLVILNRGRAQRMGSLAMTDELTQAPNRRAVLTMLSRLLQRPEAGPCAILIMDIDFFKRINDQHGHAAGDEVLKLVAAAVRTTAAAPAFFGRLGGEEFLIALPDADLPAARRFAEVLRQRVAAINTRTAIPGHSGVTTSVGLTVSIAGADDPGSMLARADTALYAAKRSGRNCVRVEPAPDDLDEGLPGPDLWRRPWCWRAPWIRAARVTERRACWPRRATSAAGKERICIRIWRGRVIVGFAAMDLLFGADIPLRRGGHPRRLFRPRQGQCAIAAGR